MNAPERRTSSAPERWQEWSARVKDIQTIIKEKNITVVKELTSGFIIDDRGEPWIFRRSPDGEMVPHHFTTLERALDQIERVIEKKAGFQETIGRYTLEIFGENAGLAKIGTTLLESSRLLNTLPPEVKEEYVQEIANDIRPELNRARSRYKKEAAEILHQIIATGGEEAKTAKKLEAAGIDIFQATIDGIRIISGENVRLISGLHWLDVWGRRSLDVYGGLIGHYKYLKELNRAVEKNKPQAAQKREYFGRGLIESLTRDRGILWKIDHIEGNPFFKRFQSREVRALHTISELINEGNYNLVEKRLREAINKLRAIRRDWKRAEIRLTGKPTKR